MLHPKEYVDKGESDRELKEALVNSRAEREGWRLRADGSLFWANEIVNAVRNKQKRLIGFVKIIKDTTEAKKSREMLKKYTRDLELTQKNLEMEQSFQYREHNRPVCWGRQQPEMVPGQEHEHGIHI